SSSAQGGYPAGNTTDTDASSYWESSNGAFPQWIQVDLGSSQSIGRLGLRLPPATAGAPGKQTLSVQTSLDGAAFSTVVGSADYVFDPATGNTVSIPFAATSARYVRLNITANTGWPAGHLSSFEVYGPAGSGSAVLALSPSALTFPTTTVNDNSDWQTVTVTNTGT